MATAQQTTGMTLKRLLARTPKFFKANAEDVVLKKLEKKQTKGGYRAVVGNAYSPDSKSKMPLPHKQTIIGIGLDTKGKALPIINCKRVLVQCSCENFTYLWEYANWKNGCSKIIYSNGEPAGMTNPANAPGLCKHLVKLADKIIAKGW